MHAQLVTALVLCAALPRMGCGGAPSGNQPACVSGAAQPQTQWFLAGDDPKDYAIASDRLVTESLEPSETIRATVPAPSNFGTVMQTIAPAAFLGQRLTFSALVKTDEVEQEAGLWMRVDGPSDEGVLAFYNMSDQPLFGTSDWTAHEVTLDVAPDARSVSFGLWLNGPGQVWLDQVTLTSCEAGTGGADAGAAPDAGPSPEVE